MPREPSITQEQVNTVADAILASCAKPTARAVRALLGSGSMDTVLGFLRVWQAAATAPAVMLRPQFDPAESILSKTISQVRADLEAASASVHQATTRLAQLEDVLGEITKQQAAANRAI